jgi:rhodanese-related sulfurtransferase
MKASEMVAAAREQVQGLSVDEVAAEIDGTDTLLVDVREPDEVAEGTIPGALPVPRGMLEFHADPTNPYHLDELRPDRRVVVYCKSGGRSALAAATLQSLGYGDVAHLDGGITAWADAQRPVAPPTTPAAG